MVSQAALSVTESEVHTVDYYINLADQLIKLGAQEICIKDMAGIGRPVSLGKIVKGIKDALHAEYILNNTRHAEYYLLDLENSIKYEARRNS